MKILARDHVLAEKERRREKISSLQRHAYGACIHIGPLSPGCRICFTGEAGGGIQVGYNCNCKCTVCYYDRDRADTKENAGQIYDIMADTFRRAYDEKWKPIVYAYQSSGETLMYIDQLLQMAPLFALIERQRKYNIYHYLYTNGTLIDEKMLDKIEQLKVKEIRFHVSASGWDEKVLDAMRLTKARGITVSVEEPSYPPERDNIMRHLPIFEEIGVTHLNLVEVQITDDNRDEIAEEYADAKIFKDHFYQLWDEGLVYDVMEEVEDKGYSFSVLDCNSHVESFRQVRNQSIGKFDIEEVRGMSTPFPYYGVPNGMPESDK